MFALDSGVTRLACDIQGRAMSTAERLIPVAVAAAAAAFSSGALASGFQLIEQNASGLGNAYSGQAAAAENASTIFWNPAGMTRIPGRQVSGALNAIRPSLKFSDNGGSRSPAGLPQPAGGDNGGDAGDWAFVPNMYLSWQLTPNLWAGLGATAPFGLKTDYDTTFIGRFQSRVAQVKTIDVNPSLAWKISDAVSIGGGVSYQKLKLSVQRSFQAAAELPQIITLEDESWGWNIGAMFNLGQNTRIGVAYRSAIEYDTIGTVAITGVGIAGGNLNVTVPDTFSWSIAHQLNPQWELLGDITYTRWSKIKTIPLVLTSALGPSPAGSVPDSFDLEFRDTFRVGLGANYKMNQQFTLKLGAAYDKSPVPDTLHRTAFLPDSDRIWLAAGGKYQFSKAMTLDFGYAHLFMDDGDTLRVKGLGARGQGTLSGTYKNHVDMVSVQVSYSF